MKPWAKPSAARPILTSSVPEIGVSPVRQWLAGRQGKSRPHFGATAGHLPARIELLTGLKVGSPAYAGNLAGQVSVDYANAVLDESQRNALLKLLDRGLADTSFEGDGNVIEGQGHGVNYAGFVIHSAIHMAKEGMNRVVMHTHTRAGMAVAALEDGLLPISMTSTQFYDDIAYHDYEGVSIYLDERERLLEALGDAKAMILRNHGLLTVGRTVPEAFLNLYRLERACQVQIDAAAAGKVRQITGNVAARSRDDLERAATDKPKGDLEFAALMRKLDKTDASYRT